ncbi:odh1 [Scenedesmus sp. PABB004]|nr:odh1 [Scenedesmus sp. PABB004]
MKLRTHFRVVVCGSGNGAQTAAGLLGSGGHDVTLYYSPKYEERAAAMRATLAANGGAIRITRRTGAGGQAETTTFDGPVAGVSTDAATALASADIVIISVTAPAMEPLLRELVPSLRHHQLLLFLQGIGPVNYLQLKTALAELADADAAAGRPHTARMPIFAAAKVLPWACRMQAPGVVTICGTKAHIDFAVGPGTSLLLAAMLPRLLGGLFEGTRFILSPNALEVTFFPYDVLGNDVLHPAIMYARWREWDGQPVPERPLFYHGMTEDAAELVEAVTAEAQSVIDAMCAAMGLRSSVYVPDPRTDLAAIYSDYVGDPSTLHSVLTTNAAYAGIFHPMRAAEGGGFVPDFTHRLLAEDVPFGLVPVRGIAEVLGVAVPNIDTIIMWAQQRLGKEFLVGGRVAGPDVAASGAPQRFGAVTPAALVITAAEDDGDDELWGDDDAVGIMLPGDDDDAEPLSSSGLITRALSAVAPGAAALRAASAHLSQLFEARPHAPAAAPAAPPPRAARRGVCGATAAAAAGGGCPVARSLSRSLSTPAHVHCF